MSKVQTFLLKVNVNNGTVIIPKQARLILGVKENLILKVENRKASLEVPVYEINDILYNLPSNSLKKSFTKDQIRSATQDEVIKRYTNSSL